MEILIYFIVWYAIGVSGSLMFWASNDECDDCGDAHLCDNCHMSLADIIVIILCAFLGLIVFVVGALKYLSICTDNRTFKYLMETKVRLPWNLKKHVRKTNI